MLRRLRKTIKLRLAFARRGLITPAFPKNDDGKILVHIGCGKRHSPEFINVDARPLPHVHIVTDDITSLGDFADGTVDLVYMSHILEHIKANELNDVLLEMKRILKVDGVLRLAVPDFDRLIEVYNDSGKDINIISRQLMGGQDHEYNTHYCIFNRGYLSTLLRQAGFRKVVPWDPENCLYHNFKDHASRTIKLNSQEYMVSLNLEAIK